MIFIFWLPTFPTSVTAVGPDFLRGQQLWTKGGGRGNITSFPVQCCWPWNTPKLMTYETNTFSQETSCVIWWLEKNVYSSTSFLIGRMIWSFWVADKLAQAACCKPEGLRGRNRGSTEDQGGPGGNGRWSKRLGSPKMSETIAKPWRNRGFLQPNDRVWCLTSASMSAR